MLPGNGAEAPNILTIKYPTIKKKTPTKASCAGSETIVTTSVWPAAPEEIRHYRALGSICRQQAALHPEASWTWLSQAEKWENLAEAAGSASSGNRPATVAPPAQEAA